VVALVIGAPAVRATSRIAIRKDMLEASVLSGLKTHLMHLDLVKEFAAEYHRELGRLNASLEQAHAVKTEEAARVDRQIRALVEAIKDGMRTPAMKQEPLALEAQKAELAAVLEHAPAPAPRIHPKLAEIYRTKVANLQAELNRPKGQLRGSGAVCGAFGNAVLLVLHGTRWSELGRGGLLQTSVGRSGRPQKSVTPGSSAAGTRQPVIASMSPSRSARLAAHDFECHVDVAACGMGIGANLFVRFPNNGGEFCLSDALVIDAHLHYEAKTTLPKQAA